MSFRCGRSLRLLRTECRPPGAKTVDVDFKYYDVALRVVRTTIAGIAVSLLASVYALLYVFPIFSRVCYWPFHQHVSDMYSTTVWAHLSSDPWEPLCPCTSHMRPGVRVLGRPSGMTH